MMDSETTKSFLGTAAKPEDLVPAVDPADLKTAYEYCCEAHARHPGRQIAIGFEDLFPTGTDPHAIRRRCVMLWLLTKAHQL
jgi:hypothetical protein